MTALEDLDGQISELQDSLRGLQNKLISVGRLDDLLAQHKQQSVDLAVLMQRRIKLER